MGGMQFSQYGEGTNVQEAFASARNQALYDHGHAGYSGSLAEKDDYVVFDVPGGSSAREVNQSLSIGDQEWLVEHFGEDLASDIYDIYDDKWGPAVALPAGPDRFLFCGWASS